MSRVCKFFLRGNCRRGNTCHFDHVLPDEDYGSEDGADVRGTSVLKRDNSSSYDSGSNYSDKTYYDDSKPNIYKKYNDRNVQGQYVTVNNDYYTTPSKQYDQRQQYQNSSQQFDQQYQSPAQRFSNDRFHYSSRQSRSTSQYHPPQNQYQSTHDNKKSPEISIDEMYVLLKADISCIENCQIWPLTSFCVVKLFGSLDDWYDYSPEEMRLAAYLAKGANNVEGYKSMLNKVVMRAQAVRDFYKTISKETSAKIKEYVKQKPSMIFPLMNNELDFSLINYSSLNLPSSSSNEFGNVLPSTSFSEQTQQPTEDTEMAHSAPKPDFFGSQSPSSVNFGLVQESKPPTDVFGSSSQESKQPTNIFGTFGQTQDQQSSKAFGFAQLNQPSSNLFAAPQNQQTSNNTFGFPQQQTSNIFGAPISQQTSEDSQTPRDLKQIYPNLNQTELDVEILSLVWHGDSPYSRKGDLTEEEYEQFKAPQFTLGKLPLIPPPRELC